LYYKVGAHALPGRGWYLEFNQRYRQNASHFELNPWLLSAAPSARGFSTRIFFTGFFTSGNFL
jgi:hypothetical protein